MRKPAQQRCSSKEGIVLHYALVFLVVTLIAGVFGVSGVVAVATNIASVLFVVALVLFVVHLITGRRTICALSCGDVPKVTTLRDWCGYRRVDPQQLCAC
jgi:uncharacterized membrane protein YtjA (UPF0391 family)